MPMPIRVLSRPKSFASECRTSRTQTESSAPKQRIANMPQAMAIITKEIAECVKMNRKPAEKEGSSELGAALAADGCRLMVSERTRPADTKKLTL
jgi:hypothetical protein